MSTYHPNHKPASQGTPPVAALEDRACAGADPAVFYPDHGGNAHEAKAICGLCPHTDPCLEWALDTKQEFGIWGGTTPEERTELLRRRRTGTENTR